MAFTIIDNQLSSAIFGGFGAGDAVAEFTSAFTAKVGDMFAAAGQMISKGASNLIAKAKQGIEFFTQWWKDDPVGATAGATAAVLTLGVVIVVGGAAITAIPGGIAALRAMPLMTLLRKAVVTGITAVGLGALVRFAVRGVQYAWNFNWNISDNQIRSQQKGLIDGLYGQFGEAAGTAAASLLCGFAPVEIIKRSNLVRVNPRALAYIKEITEFDPQSDQYGELYEEMMENLRALVNAGTRAASQIMFLESYKNIRKWIKSGAKAINLSKSFPALGKMIEKWGAEGSQAWSFASAVEDWIESIDDKNIQNFTEEFVESFMDVCTENVMIISYAL